MASGLLRLLGRKLKDFLTTESKPIPEGEREALRAEATGWLKDWYEHPETVKRLESFNEQDMLKKHHNTGELNWKRRLRTSEFEVEPYKKLLGVLPLRGPLLGQQWKDKVTLYDQWAGFYGPTGKRARERKRQEYLSTSIHEFDHLIRKASYPAPKSADTGGYLWNKLKPEAKDAKPGTYKEMIIPPMEVNARLMEIRHKLGIIPGEKINQNMIDSNKEVLHQMPYNDLLKVYEKKDIIEILNTVAEVGSTESYENI